MSTTISGTTGIDKVQDGNTINASSIMGALNATGSAPIYACRAWVNFNGTGTVAIRASGNVSSITDNGVGNYTVNFTTAMPDANYSTQITGSGDAESSVRQVGTSINTYSTSSVKVYTVTDSTVSVDHVVVNVAVFR
jgi:hypothetical protein